MTKLSRTNVESPKVKTNSIVLGERDIHGITDDFNASSPDLIPSSYALSMAIGSLIQKINESQGSSGVSGSSDAVLSASIVSTSFISVADDTLLGWRRNGWVSDAVLGDIYLRNVTGTTPTNSLAVPADRFQKSGKYLFILNVKEINGTLTVRKTDGSIIGTITTVGSHAFVFENDITYSNEIYITVTGLPVSKSIVLTEVYLGVIRYELIDYVNMALNEALTTFGGGLLTRDNAEDIVSEIIGDSLDAINSHLGNINNPHNVTPEQIGAAVVDHTHTLEDLGAAAIDHSHSLASLGAAPAVHTHDQYLLKSDIPSLTAVKAAIPAVVNNTTIGRLPNFVDGYGLIEGLPINIMTRQMYHTSSKPYDHQSGILYTNFFPVDANMVSCHTDNTARAAIIENDAAFQSTTRTIRYEMHTVRTVSQITINRDRTGAVPGHPASVIIRLDGVEIGSYALSILDTAFERVLNIAPMEASVIEMDIIPSSDAQMSFGFSLVFSDITTGYDYALPKGLSVTMEDDVSVSVISALEQHVPFNIPFPLIEGYNYPIILTKDNSSNALQVGFANIAPVYGTEDRSAMSDKFTSNTHNFFGTVAVDGIADPTKSYEIYGSNNSVSSVANTMAIYHTFTENMNISSLRLVFDSLAKTPSHIRVRKLNTGDVVTTIYDEDIHPFSMGEYFVVDITVQSDISGFTIEMTSSTGDTISLSRCDVFFDSLSYDTRFYKWEDNVKRIVIGRVCKVGNGYRFISTGLGRVAEVPVNNFNLCNIATTYTVYNPFGTSQIEVEVIPIDKDQVNVSTAFDSELIYIQNMTKARYVVRITRLW